MLTRIKGFPFYCKSCNTSHFNISSIYSKTLYDSILLWAYLLNKTIPLHGDEVFKNALLYRQSWGDTYMGITGPMSFDSNCYRLPITQLDGLDSNGSTQTYFNYSFINLSNFTRTSIFLNNLDQTMFQNWGKTIA
uniref:ANF_receptor domain-containing protein n=1 Tax=Rhabditophanes sp. KR3021 TaxID=114890 RepID=A0AC35TLA3_9BILA